MWQIDRPYPAPLSIMFKAFVNLLMLQVSGVVLGGTGQPGQVLEQGAPGPASY